MKQERSGEMGEFKMMYSGMMSGKTNEAAMRLADLARNYTAVEIIVVSEEMKSLQQENQALRERIAKLEATVRFARSRIRMLCNNGDEIRDFLGKTLAEAEALEENEVASDTD